MATERTPPKEKKRFEIGDMADDLVDLTLELCGKDRDHTPRFPERFYQSYVSAIITMALSVQEHIVLANETRENNTAERRKLQSSAEAKCVYLNHLIRAAWKKGWISDKQQERWSGLATSLRWKIYNWWKST